MKIQELEGMTGLDRATIRYYEREGLISPQRRENGYRDYSKEDAETLLKIRLLRQLGMPLQQIRQLQLGTEDFAQLLAQRIESWNRKIQEGRRAREVCARILSDGVDYQSLDAGHYLWLLEQPLEVSKPVVPPFREPLPEQIYPWRRFFARTVDMLLVYSLALFLLIAVLRLRPAPGLMLQVLIAMACTALFVPLEALMLHFWGTTPGKWLFGIRLESQEGRKLSWEEALERSWGVYSAGMGYGIPYVNLLCNQMSYCTLTGRSWWRFARYDQVNPPDDMKWDDGVEAFYSPIKGKRLAVCLAVIVMIFGSAALDSLKPQYRGDKLTVTQFARNYNASLVFSDWDLNKLQDDGSVEVFGDYGVTIYMSGTSEKEYAVFAYSIENGYLTGITYENSWTDVTYLNPLGGECYQAAESLLRSRDGFRLSELKEFRTLWNSNLGKEEADFSYHGIRIQWKIKMENCKPMDSGLASILGKGFECLDEELPAKLELSFQLSF